VIAVVDYGLGNLASVRNALQAIGAEVEVTADPAVIDRALGVILPGVGAASFGMERLRARGLESVIRDAALRETPLLGLCLGMQLLFNRSEEGNVSCLGLIPGTVRLLRVAEKVPQIGWNQVRARGADALWRYLPENPYFYFVHSYVCEPDDPCVVAGTTEYGATFCSVVAQGSIWGTQFHPERSGAVGLRLLENFHRFCSARFPE